MVRADASMPMMVMRIVDGIADCVFIDGNGRIRHRFHMASALTPLWMTLGPKSMWPEITQLDLLAIEEEERIASEERKIEKRKSRRAKRSHKLKRKRAA